MATPRKHWLRLYESMLDEPWDDATLAAVVRLMCWLNRRWARNGIAHEDAGKARIEMHELCSLMRRSRPATALALLRRCADAVTLAYTVCATSVEIDWPKFAILQEYGPRKTPGDRAVTTPSDSDSDSDSDSEKKEEEKSAARRSSAAKGLSDRKAPPAPKAKRTPKLAAPKPSARAIAVFSEEFKTALGVNPAIPPRDFRDLGDALQQLGEERLRGALRKFFEWGETDQWIKQQGYSSREFLRQLTKSDLHAQKTHNRPRLVEEPEPMEDPEAFFGAQFSRVAL